ncbi:uncharacterized protein B0H18DRAFT_1118150 [Fomitopsis serialis]|uniref:uncharacterized protein n=1 Tax=Fomitopsis serialis TaxID=139415 RepID=UPI0020072FC4|nr:uncharacterized protein B0H18DRAFT_1118150 [Neoantrodia serialis]KAH9928131.1 hypothetical protein B0H18DRAFT_1118150 [Neoantrodia serialis]
MTAAFMRENPAFAADSFTPPGELKTTSLCREVQEAAGERCWANPAGDDLAVNISIAPADVSSASYKSPVISPFADTAATSVTLRDSLPSQETVGQVPYTHWVGAGALLRSQARAGRGRPPWRATSSATDVQLLGWSANATLARIGDEASSESLGLGERRAGKGAAGGGSLHTIVEGGKGNKVVEMDQVECRAQYRSVGAQKPEQRQAAADKTSLPASWEDAGVDDTPKGGGPQEEDEEEGGEMHNVSTSKRPRNIFKRTVSHF